MGLMGTLAKVAIGYAAARGVDKLSGGQGLGAMLGGGAQVPGSEKGTDLQAQMGQFLGGGAGNPLQDMMEKMQQGGLGAMLGAAGLGGTEGSSGDKGGLLSALSGQGGAGLAGLLAMAGGAASMGGKGLGGMLDQVSATEAAPEAEAAAGLMLRAMIQAAKSDGGIDEAEKAKILETVGDDAAPEDIAFVKEQLAAPVDAAALAADTPEAQKAQVYAASLMTIRVDTPAEAQYLDALAKAMGLSELVVNQLHMQMGLQPLYS
ncbi:tellurite resistance TerB family protein [Salipiger sp. P9]|uniref:tellurite resistance TerB family protein n=1 Tax=Salipiger pentaromativorans TaxID=2943193 RepID=UPI002157D91F|nr:tellurite resistance TerB family protein [Salipiger pentaromativorans]MCR8547361.1 tellurite resistance TerB family protein [Salipiger pentaromativorans]